MTLLSPEGRSHLEPLWFWVREREAIRQAKNGGANELTLDPILAKFRFCNVRREDDRGTVWVREHIREPFAGHPNLWLMLCIARVINWPDTLAELIAHPHAWPLDDTFDPADLAGAMNARQRRGDKLYTGAYMIPAPQTKGTDKQSWLAATVIGGLWKRRDIFARHFAGSDATLQRTHELIMRTDGWGPFLAYQAVVDMRFTRLLHDAPDRATWAAAGPGTLRGLNRTHGRPVDAALSQPQALREMRAIYAEVESRTGVTMDFSDVPNILCETDKYLRVKNGEGKPRALYVPGRGC